MHILPRTKALTEYIGRSWDVLSTIRPEVDAAAALTRMHDDKGLKAGYTSS